MNQKSKMSTTTFVVQGSCYTSLLVPPSLVRIPTCDNERTQANESLVEGVEVVSSAWPNSPGGYGQTTRVSSRVIDRSCRWSGRGGGGGGGGGG